MVALTSKKRFYHPFRCARFCPASCSTRLWWRLPSIWLAPIRGSRQSCTSKSYRHRTAFPNETVPRFPTKTAQAIRRIFGAFLGTVPWTERGPSRTSHNTADRRFLTCFHFRKEKIRTIAVDTNIIATNETTPFTELGANVFVDRRHATNWAFPTRVYGTENMSIFRSLAAAAAASNSEPTLSFANNTRARLSIRCFLVDVFNIIPTPTNILGIGYLIIGFKISIGTIQLDVLLLKQ